jgi:acyl-CoA synthetase (NDP forming)
MSIHTIIRLDTTQDFNDFAVGILRQPLPNGMRFAIVTNTGFHGITATDACARFGSDPIGASAKTPPTATLSTAETLSTTGRTAVGPRTITNGVKQQRSAVRFPGGESS